MAKVVYNDLPYNADAERSVLGACLISKDCLYTVLSQLKEEDFYELKHQIMYKVLVQLQGENITSDVLTMAEALINMKELETVGGVEYLQKCAESVVSISSLDFYLNIVKDQSCLRSMLLAIREIDNKYRSEEIKNVNNFIQQSEEIFKASTESRRVSSFKSTKNIAKEVEISLKTIRQEDDDGATGLTTGFSNINRLTQGFQKGELTILAARPSVGKTALALNIAFKVATLKKVPVAIFSIEMQDQMLVKRLVSAESNVDMKRIIAGTLNAKERIDVAAAIKVIAESPIYIDQTSGIQIMDLVAKSRQLQAKRPDLGLIVIDYLGLIQTATKGKSQDSRNEEVRKISLALKSLAKDLNVPILCLSQLSRGVEARDNKRPMLSDLRDSGNIEQDADVVMFLYRPDYYKMTSNKGIGNKKGIDLTASDKFEMARAQREKQLKSELPGNASYVEVLIEKNRNGQTGTCGLFFYKSYQRFEVPSKDWEEEMRNISEGFSD